ncbi:MAG TPA: diaminopimelate decarboxylase [Bacteroidia bacterium]|jgi:diaminopimelate decarboxylase|nr:diaminopimelate decarboxylase [Bacteroidia bacterium]
MSALNKYHTFFLKHKTPFYFYDTSLLKQTLDELNKTKGDYHVHYALKANTNNVLLRIIKEAALGADCVSGNEVKKAVEIGFEKGKIVFAGVGKSDDEINYALQQNIFCFNCESIPEMEVINSLAKAKNITANIALRINPNVDAHTHHYITTGLEENKFGINVHELAEVTEVLKKHTNLNLIGLHFHIGSSINDLTPFKNLCTRVNEIQQWFLHRGYKLPHINVGGGLGINYKNPDGAAICNFEAFFNVFRRFLQIQDGQEVHFELGRAVTGQCGNLISRVLYIKKGTNTNFAILDAGMTELIRPALYQAYHKIENISTLVLHPSSLLLLKYDVVGPICESSDCFGKAVDLPETKRGDIIAIRSAGAYGEVMSSQYNLRDKVQSHFNFETEK